MAERIGNYIVAADGGLIGLDAPRLARLPEDFREWTPAQAKAHAQVQSLMRTDVTPPHPYIIGDMPIGYSIRPSDRHPRKVYRWTGVWAAIRRIALGI